MIFDASHRCDSCSAQAYAVATLHSGNQLFFCAHHLKKHKVAMEPFLDNLEDQTDLLFKHVEDDKHVV